MSQTPSRIVADPSGGEFHDQRFPPEISLGAVGGPERKTDVVLLASGHERRNAARRRSRRRYNAGYGIKSLNDIEAAVAFFEARRGRLHAFRWKDHLDYRSAPFGKPLNHDDQVAQRLDDQGRYQLVKTYNPDCAPYQRPIRLPVEGTIRVSVNGKERTDGFDVQLVGGVITFQDKPPKPDHVVAAGFEFDVPVRFDADSISAALTSRAAGEIPDIPIIEVADLENR